MSFPDYIIQFREVPQKIDQINQILGQALTSKGKQYLVIDPSSNSLGLTRDKSKASSMFEVAQWVGQVCNQIAADKSIDQGQVGELHLKISKLVRKEEKSKNLIQRLFDKIFNSKATRQTKEIFDAIDDTISKRHDYGQKTRPEGKPKITRGSTGKGPRIEIEGFTETRSYAEDREERLKPKIRAETSTTFDKIKDQKNSRKVILQAFKNEFQNRLGGMRLDKEAVEHVHNVFDNVLGLMEDEIVQVVPIRSQGPQKALQRFADRFNKELLAGNRIVLEFDRETFRDLMGSNVEGGRGKDIPIVRTPAIKNMIKDYNSGAWGPDEERTYSYDAIHADVMPQVKVALEGILGNPDFKKVLGDYLMQARIEMGKKGKIR